VRLAAWGAQDFHEEAAASEIVAEAVIDKLQARAQQSNCVGTHALELGARLHDLEQLEHGKRCALEHLGVSDFEEAIVRLEAAIDRDDPGASALQDGFVEMLQQNFVQ